MHQARYLLDAHRHWFLHVIVVSPSLPWLTGSRIWLSASLTLIPAYRCLGTHFLRATASTLAANQDPGQWGLGPTKGSNSGILPRKLSDSSSCRKTGYKHYKCKRAYPKNVSSTGNRLICMGLLEWHFAICNRYISWSGRLCLPTL